ncbi:MAG: DUF2860 family protein [Deltaproteobacteria bacterium]|nr:MAG: DUF2860 family protein [Deltaproteobacteria bacterium]
MLRKLIVLLILLPCLAHAAERKQNSIELGILSIEQANNLNTWSSNNRIENLMSEPQSHSRLLPIVLFDLNLRYGKGNFLYLKTPILELESSGIALGTEYQLSNDRGVLDLSVSFFPFDEEWKNPYQTGVDRQDTDVTKFGIKLAWKEILNTGLEVDLSAQTIDLQDDEIGELFDALRRDGTTYAASVSYAFKLRQSVRLKPGLSFRRGNLDGESNSYDGYSASLMLIYAKRRYMLMPRLFYGVRDYEGTHPLFESKRDDVSWGAVLMATYFSPFDLKGYFVRGFLGYATTNSNIAFFDTEGKFAGVTFGYSF